jgi:hypothetical protein
MRQDHMHGKIKSSDDKERVICAKYGWALQVVDWGFACGRHYLVVAGHVVVTEVEICRDADLSL